MPKAKKYRLNAETLTIEVARTPKGRRVFRVVAFFVVTMALSVLYFWIYTGVLGWELPKTALLKYCNAGWSAKVALMDRNLDAVSASLEELAGRDNNVYRSVFGMNEIPDAVRNAGLSGENRYEELDGVTKDGMLASTVVRLDVLTKKAYIQSKSYDEIWGLAVRAGDMASCVPSIPPIYPDPKTYRYTSPFGNRADPIGGYRARHTGIDLATDKGNPVYATGDGVVEDVVSERGGYGRYVIINHGFGYKTRYAHLNEIVVTEGQQVRRGDHIAYSGNSGKSTGAHLHYEVIYKGNYVNPLNYMDLHIDLGDYRSMVTLVPKQKPEPKGKNRK